MRIRINRINTKRGFITTQVHTPYGWKQLTATLNRAKEDKQAHEDELRTELALLFVARDYARNGLDKLGKEI